MVSHTDSDASPARRTARIVPCFRLETGELSPRPEPAWTRRSGPLGNEARSNAHRAWLDKIRSCTVTLRADVLLTSGQLISASSAPRFQVPQVPRVMSSLDGFPCTGVARRTASARQGSPTCAQDLRSQQGLNGGLFQIARPDCYRPARGILTGPRPATLQARVTTRRASPDRRAGPVRCRRPRSSGGAEESLRANSCAILGACSRDRLLDRTDAASPLLGSNARSALVR